MRFFFLNWLIAIIFSLISVVGVAMSSIPSSIGTDLLKDIKKLNRVLIDNPALLSGTRLKDVDLSGLVLKDVTLKDLDWRSVKLEGSRWSNVTIKDSVWLGVKLERSELDNVVFDHTRFDWNRGADRYGEVRFNKSKLNSVHFIHSDLRDVQFSSLQPSQLYFEHSQLHTELEESYVHRTGVIRYSEVKLYIKDSDFRTETIYHLKYPSEAYIENSRFIGGISGKFKRLEIRNSHYDGNSAEPDYLLIENSTINTGSPEAGFIHLKNNKYLLGDIGSSIGIPLADTVLIEDCQSPLYLGIPTKARINKLYIRDCMLIEPSLRKSKIGYFEICDSMIESDPKKSARRRYRPKAWDNASIRELNLYNVRFEGEFPQAKNLHINTLGSDGQHPIPERLRQAADQQQDLQTCPTLPDTEALKRRALQPPTDDRLSVLLQERTSALHQRRADRLNPFNRIIADAQQLIIPFDTDWLRKHQYLYSLGAGIHAPPLQWASLYIYNHENDRFIDQRHYQADQPMDEQGELSLTTLRPEQHFGLVRSIDTYLSRVPMLYLWFAPAEAPVAYDDTTPWAIALATQPGEDGHRLDPSRSYLEANPVWHHSHLCPKVEPPSPDSPPQTA